MATRRRSTRSTAARSTAARRPSRSYRYGSQRRRPKLATTLGGAAAVALVALFTRLSWGLRIGLVALVIVGAVGYLLWRRRARIVEEIAAETAQRQSPPNGPA